MTWTGRTDHVLCPYYYFLFPPLRWYHWQCSTRSTFRCFKNSSRRRRTSECALASRRRTERSPRSSSIARRRRTTLAWASRLVDVIVSRWQQSTLWPMSTSYACLSLRSTLSWGLLLVTILLFLSIQFIYFLVWIICTSWDPLLANSADSLFIFRLASHIRQILRYRNNPSSVSIL